MAAYEQETGLARNDAAIRLASIGERHPKSKAALAISEQLVTRQYEHALKFETEGDLPAAIKTLEWVMRVFPKEADPCLVAHTRITKQILTQAAQSRQAGGDILFAEQLRGIAATYDETRVAKLANETLRELAINMIAEARTASLGRDPAEKKATLERLEKAFGNDPMIAELRQQATKDELRARAALRRAERAVNMTSLIAAKGQFEAITKQFPGTLAAAKAANRLKEIPREVDRDEDDLVELIQMMEQ